MGQLCLWLTCSMCTYADGITLVSYGTEGTEAARESLTHQWRQALSPKREPRFTAFKQYASRPNQIRAAGVEITIA